MSFPPQTKKTSEICLVSIAPDSCWFITSSDIFLMCAPGFEMTLNPLPCFDSNGSCRCFTRELPKTRVSIGCDAVLAGGGRDRDSGRGVCGAGMGHREGASSPSVMVGRVLGWVACGGRVGGGAGSGAGGGGAGGDDTFIFRSVIL